MVVLAGDIHKGDKAVAWAERQFAGIPVLYVHGNHEAYGMNLEDMQADQWQDGKRQLCPQTGRDAVAALSDETENMPVKKPICNMPAHIQSKASGLMR